MSIYPSGSLRCSAWARQVGLDPTGSAGSYEGFLIIDIPLPWPRDLADHAELDGLGALLASAGESGLRVQGRVPVPGLPRQVELYRRTNPDGFTGFTHTKLDLTEGSGKSAKLEAAGTMAEEAVDVLGVVERLLRAPVEPASDPPPRVLPTQVLVCTHGRRDVCCGSLGTLLYSELVAASQTLPGGVRLARTSHTGGHRFAPTFLVLPEATMWAFGDLALVIDVLGRRGDPSAVADRYRGCAALGGPRVQVLEREVLKRVGWELLDVPRRGEETSGEAVALEVRTRRGVIERWEAEVTPLRTMPVPDCGQPLEQARKSATEWEVRGLRRRSSL